MVTYVDFCAGIGGFRLALDKLGCSCVFTSEIEPHAISVYRDNFKDSLIFGDFTTSYVKQRIPDHDLFVAGFPCQPFSLIGLMKGFKDSRGTIIFHIADILKKKQPKAFLLENVVGLAKINNGKLLYDILKLLREYSGYYVPEPQKYNAVNFNVPQNRNRIYIVGFRPDVLNKCYIPPIQNNKIKTVRSILETDVDFKYYLTETYYKYLLNREKKNKAVNNSFGYSVLDLDKPANTLLYSLSCLDYNLIDEGKSICAGRVQYRNLTPLEAKRVQGFPDDFKMNVTDAWKYKLLGNSVSPPVIEAIGIRILYYIDK